MFVGESEIHQQDPATLLAHHVGGLDVAMEESRGMHRAGRAADVNADQRCFARSHRALRGDEFCQRLALDEVAPETDASVVTVHAVNRHDIRVPHPCDRSRFAKKRADFLVSIEPAWQEEFQRNVALKRRVERAINFSERAAADALQVFEGSPAIQRIRRRVAGQSRFELGFVQNDTD